MRCTKFLAGAGTMACQELRSVYSDGSLNGDQCFGRHHQRLEASIQGRYLYIIVFSVTRNYDIYLELES
jgi:hypothetical protein